MKLFVLMLVGILSAKGAIPLRHNETKEASGLQQKKYASDESMQDYEDALNMQRSCQEKYEDCKLSPLGPKQGGSALRTWLDTHRLVSMKGQRCNICQSGCDAFSNRRPVSSLQKGLDSQETFCRKKAVEGSEQMQQLLGRMVGIVRANDNQDDAVFEEDLAEVETILCATNIRPPTPSRPFATTAAPTTRAFAFISVTNDEECVWKAYSGSPTPVPQISAPLNSITRPPIK